MDGERLRLRLAGDVELSGSEPGLFDVVILRPGKANGVTFGEAVLRASVEAGVWEGAACFVDHPSWLSVARSVRDLAGVVEDVRFDGAVRGRLRAVPPAGEVLEAVARGYLEDVAAGRRPANVGLSADVWLRRDGERNVTSIDSVESVDLVFRPAAGGEFERALNQRQEGVEVTDNGGAGAAVAGVQEVEALRLELSAARLERLILQAGLSATLAEEVRRRCAGRALSVEEINGEIEAVQKLAAAVRGAGGSVSLPGTRLDSGGKVSDGFDRLMAAFGRLMGLKPESEAEADVPRLSGVREWYQAMTGDYQLLGEFQPERMLFANVTTSVMANVTANILNKVMLGAFNVREKWWGPITRTRELPTMQDMAMLKLYGFSSLSTVSEGAAYTEKTWDDLKETASFVKKGNYVGITLEMIRKDDTESVRAIPTMLGHAAWNTLSDSVSAIFTDNSGTGPAMADGHSVFDAANHGNLLTTAFGTDTTAWGAVVTAMMKQTEPGSSRRLGAMNIPRFCLVPVDLRTTALVVRNSSLVPGGGNNDVNIYYNDFEVITVPTWTDANDWAAVADPDLVPGIIIGHLAGEGPEPRIFVADENVVGSMFTNDELRVKVRFIYAVGVADYRPLHKNNVT